MSKKLVLMDHDGGLDDFLAMMLLMTMVEVEPIGVVVTPADCYANAAVSVTRKILDLMERSNIPVAQSTVRGLNPFPPSFRRDCVIVDNFPILNEQDAIATPLVAESGQQFIVRALQTSPEPVTLMVTGPLTTVAEAIALKENIVTKIKEIIWMGGALEVSGNVEKEFALEQDGTAEWNVFWDPLAAKQIWETSIPIILCPLDITNTVPVTPEFIRQLAKQRHYPLSDLAGMCYALAIPQAYYFWDILATAYLGCPQYYSLEEQETDIITTGMSQGKTVIKPGGKKTKVMKTVDKESFYRYCLRQLAC